MKILPATPCDADEILALQKQAYYSEAVLNNDFSIPPLTQTLEQLRAEFAHKCILKVVVDDQILGSGQVKLDKASALIGRVIVRPDFWGQGIGSDILSALESAFPQAERYELFTGANSAKNLAFYKKRGYREFKSVQAGPVQLIFLKKPANPSASPLVHSASV